MDDVESILRSNQVLASILERAGQLGLPNWYLGAGCLAQTVWNELHGFDPQHGIGDYDLVYFDSADLTEVSEQAAEARANALFAGLDAKLDVKNEARVEQRIGCGSVLTVATWRSITAQATATRRP